MAITLYREADIPPGVGDVVFREAAWPRLLMTGIILAAGVFWTVLALSGKLPVLIAIFLGVIALVCALLLLLLVPWAAGAFRRNNWVLRYGPGGLWIKFRSPSNRNLPAEDPTVAFVPTTDIACVRRSRATQEVPDSEGATYTQRTHALDIVLKSDGTDRLAEAAAYERALPPMPARVGKAKVHHYPVNVPTPGLIRVEWRGSQSAVTPRLSKALRTLGRTIPIGEDVNQDAGKWEDLDDAQFHAYLRSLVESGNQIAAIRAVRLRFGCDLAEAKRVIDNLRAGRLE